MEYENRKFASNCILGQDIDTEISPLPRENMMSKAFSAVKNQIVIHT